MSSKVFLRGARQKVMVDDLAAVADGGRRHLNTLRSDVVLLPVGLSHGAVRAQRCFRDVIKQQYVSGTVLSPGNARNFDNDQ